MKVTINSFMQPVTGIVLVALAVFGDQVRRGDATRGTVCDHVDVAKEQRAGPWNRWQWQDDAIDEHLVDTITQAYKYRL